MSDESVDSELLRAAVFGLLERIDQLAVAVLGGSPRERPRDADRPADADQVADGDAAPGLGTTGARRTEIPGRVTVDLLLGEIAEPLSKLIAQLIAILEAISAALESVAGDRHRRERSAPTAPANGFQPIAVQIAPRREPAPHE